MMVRLLIILKILSEIGTEPRFCSTMLPTPAKKSKVIGQGKSKESKGSSESKKIIEAETKFLENADILLKAVSEDFQVRKQTKIKNEAQSYFATYIAHSLRQLPNHLQFACQNELNQVLYKYQAAHIMEQAEPSDFEKLLQ